MYECVDCSMDFALDEGTLFGGEFFQCDGCTIRTIEGKATEEYYVLEGA